jgi:hypothetical protein
MMAGRGRSAISNFLLSHLAACRTNFRENLATGGDMRSPIARFVFAIVLGAHASTAHAQLLSRRDLSYSIAKTIAETAIERCTANGYRVSAVVVDRAGETIVALRGDNASPHTMENRAARPTLP